MDQNAVDLGNKIGDVLIYVFFAALILLAIFFIRYVYRFVREVREIREQKKEKDMLASDASSTADSDNYSEPSNIPESSNSADDK